MPWVMKLYTQKIKLNAMRCILICSLILSSLTGFSQKKKELTPRKSIGKVTLKGKKEYTYYALSEKARTEYRVKGPGKLYLNFRVRLENDNFNSAPFKVKYTESSNNVRILEIPGLLSSNLKFTSKSLAGNPTKVHREVIHLPPGEHKLRFYKYRTDQKVHMRAFYQKDPAPKWRDLQPEQAIEKKEVRFVKSGKSQLYYRISKKTDFDFTLRDTARLRIIVRPEFTYRMLNETLLKIKVENLTTGKSATYKINSFRSSSLEFVQDKKHTPGRSRIFYLNLPKPENKADRYVVRLVSGAKGAVMRLSIDENLRK